MEIIGKDIEVGFGVEETRGTPQGTAEKWMKNVTANILVKTEKAIDDNSQGVLEDSLQSRVVKKWIEGDLNGIVHADAIGYLIYNLYGSVSEAVVSGSVVDHTFNLAQSIQHASLSILAKDGSVQQKVFDNCMVGTLELTAVVDDFVRFSATFMGADEAANSDTPSYDTEYDFIGKDVEVKVAATEAGLVGATATKVKELTITFDQGLISDHILNQDSPDDVYNGKMSIEGSFTKNFDDATFKDLYRADTARYMQIKITGTQDIGSGNNPTITILLNKVQIMEWERSGDNDNLVEETIGFKAFYNESDSKQSQLTLRNLTSEYDEPISA